MNTVLVAIMHLEQMKFLLTNKVTDLGGGQISSFHNLYFLVPGMVCSRLV